MAVSRTARCVPTRGKRKILLTDTLVLTALLGDRSIHDPAHNPSIVGFGHRSDG